MPWVHSKDHIIYHCSNRKIRWSTCDLCSGCIQLSNGSQALSEQATMLRANHCLLCSWEIEMRIESKDASLQYSVPISDYWHASEWRPAAGSASSNPGKLVMLRTLCPEAKHVSWPYYSNPYCGNSRTACCRHASVHTACTESTVSRGSTFNDPRKGRK